VIEEVIVSNTHRTSRSEMRANLAPAETNCPGQPGAWEHHDKRGIKA